MADGPSLVTSRLHGMGHIASTGCKRRRSRTRPGPDKWRVSDERYPAGMTDERPSHEEMDAMVAEMVQAGLLTVGTDAAGRETWTLTPQGAQVATQMAISSEDDAFALLDALLDD